MLSDTKKELSELRALLQEFDTSLLKKKVFVGFDGFVDTIMKAVSKQKNYETVFMDKVEEFALRIGEAKGKSGQIELKTQNTKLGGNAPILANALGLMGIQCYCFGAMGYPNVYPQFNSMSQRCEIKSLIDPGNSNAIEFSDGKVILSELSSFERYDWNYLKSTDCVHKIQRAISECELICLVDWANLPHAGDIWQGLLEDVIKTSGRKDYEFFFDLCDPSKKTTEQIDEVLDLIGRYSYYGTVSLGMNENESRRIWCALKGHHYHPDSKSDPDLESLGRELFNSMNIHRILIHPIDRCIMIERHRSTLFDGRLVRNPRLTTGAGDNLNAGYCLGLLAGFPIHHAIRLGMAAAGAYVQNGISADRQALIDYIDKWIKEVSPGVGLAAATTPSIF